MVRSEDGAGSYTDRLHGEGERVGDGQPVEQALVLVFVVDGVKHQAVDDEEKAIGRQLCNGKYRGETVSEGSAGEGENKENREVAVKLDDGKNLELKTVGYATTNEKRFGWPVHPLCSSKAYSASCGRALNSKRRLFKRDFLHRNDRFWQP